MSAKPSIGRSPEHARGRIRLGERAARVVIEYGEQEARDGRLLAQLGRRTFTAGQLRELATLLEAEEAELKRMRWRYGAMAEAHQLLSADTEPEVSAVPVSVAVPGGAAASDDDNGEEDCEDLDETVRQEGDVVAKLESRSDNMGGCSVVTMYRHAGRFHVQHDAGSDSYATAGEALTGGGWDRALSENREEGASHEVWIRPRLRRG